MSNRKRHACALSTMAVASLVSGACAAADKGLSFLDPQGPIARAQTSHIIDVVALLCIVVLPVFVLVPLFAWRYRYSNEKAVYRPHWTGNRTLEIIQWGIPVVIVALLSAVLIRSTVELDPYERIYAHDLVPADEALASDKEPLPVQVVGTDWNWLFIYPEFGIATSGELAFPVDRQMALDITSLTAMQSFFIPSLGSQIYAMGGMANKLHLAADAPGEFLGQNAQYNGDGFAQQKFTARALEPAQFDAWVDEVRSSGAALDDDALAVLTDRNTLAEAREKLPEAARTAGTLYFDEVPENLFERLMAHVRVARSGHVEDSLPTLGEISMSALMSDPGSMCLAGERYR